VNVFTLTSLFVIIKYKYIHIFDFCQKSRRTVPIPVEVVSELKSYKAKQAEDKLFFGQTYHKNDLVFCSSDGRPIDPRNFTRQFEGLLKKAGLPRVSFHDMRHYGERYKMVSGDCKPAKPPAYPSIHSPFDHYLLSELRYSIRFLSSDQSGSSLVGRMSIYAASSAFRRVSVSALA